jgi:hypothetical protein
MHHLSPRPVHHAITQVESVMSGLLLVSELADKWGVGERGLGKIVWCEFAVLGPEETGLGR